LEFRDLIVAPVAIFTVYLIAYLVRPFVTDPINRRYFFPALTARVFSAIALGLLYQFYYNGGDTYNYHTHGSRHVWNAFMDDPYVGIKLLFADGSTHEGMYRYSSKILFFQDQSSYMVIRIATIIDLFTFSSYVGTAIFFSAISFIGAWMLFLAFYKDYQHLHKSIAFAALFIPSVVFWGSALLKDTITLACIGMATYYIRNFFMGRGVNLFQILMLALSLYIVFSIKKYVLLCFVPAAMLWIYFGYLSRFRSLAFKVIMVPLILGISVVSGFVAIEQIGKNDPRYALARLGETARITAYDIRYYTGKDAGSGYSLGELDGTFQGMLKLTPQAINVSLFRPYFWEIRNPLMILSAVESFCLLIMTLYLVISSGRFLGKGLFNADALFCFVFSITFAFAVGVSTYNFGTLSRYKIPLMPFFAIGLILLNSYVKSERKLLVLDRTE
jgi:hypothetical protein